MSGSAFGSVDGGLHQHGGGGGGEAEEQHGADGEEARRDARTVPFRQRT